MAEPSPDTVFVAESLPIAEAVIQYLAAHDIPAEAFSSATHVDSEPVTGVSEVSAGEQFEVRVTDLSKLDLARKFLLSEESAAIVRFVRAKRLQRTGTVTVTCEECGKSSTWPASSMGTTEHCPHCMNYLDVPDPDDDWSGVDFGEPEEGESPP